MNNEIGRKITSLTLMTIMLAAGFSAFAPSTMPEAAAANANLFVSAENSQFQNYFAGPQVIEVVVIDSDIKDTDKGKGEPDVTVNGNKLRMVQATDGNWYGYFADRDQALKADAIAAGAFSGNIQTASKVAGNGTDFGSFCSSTNNFAGVSFTQTVGVAFPGLVLTGDPDGNLNGGDITSTCAANAGSILNGTAINVVREEKSINQGTGSTVLVGQIGLFANSSPDKTGTRVAGVINSFWPFVQLYTFSQGGNIVVQYNKGGGVQSTTLKFDTVDQFAKLDLDRTSYPVNTQVHATITDLQLNIDPTDEDTWVFGTKTTNATLFYNVFNENGQTSGRGYIHQGLTGNRTSLMFEDNGVLKLDPTATSTTKIVLIQDNADSNATATGDVATARVDVGPGQFISSPAVTFTTGAGSQPVSFTETAPNTGVFGTYDESDISTLKTTSNAPRGKSATIDYNNSGKSIVIGFGFASLDIQLNDAEWNSGQLIPVMLTDSDANKNSRLDEDLDLNDASVGLIPSLRVGTPFTLGQNGTEVDVSTSKYSTILAKTFTNYNVGHGGKKTTGNFTDVYMTGTNAFHDVKVDKFSDRAIIKLDGSNNEGRSGVQGLLITYGKTVADLKKVVYATNSTPGTGVTRLHGFDFFNYDIRGLSNSTITGVNGSLAIPKSVTTRLVSTNNLQNDFLAVSMFNGSKQNDGSTIGTLTNAQGLINLNKTSGVNTRVIDRLYGINNGLPVGVFFAFNPVQLKANAEAPIVADFFSFGYVNDGINKVDRVNNMIVRIEAEETGDNTSVFEGSLEFVMLNQLNILEASTYSALTTVADDPSFIVHQDLDDEEAPRVNYNDLGADGVVTQVSTQEDAPTHSGVVSFNQPTYKKADTVVVTLEDQDLNTDVDLIDIYTAVNSSRDQADGTIGKGNLPILSNGDPLGRLLDITFDDRRWRDVANSCTVSLDSEGIDLGLVDAGFTLIETGAASGIFTGDYQVPGKICRPADSSLGLSADTSPVNAQGLDMEVNYVDFRDASGQIVEVGDGAGIRANTGSVSLDRTVYPVPFGAFGNFDQPSGDKTSPNGRAIFPIHLTGVGSGGPKGTTTDTGDIQNFETIPDGVLTIHVQVNDPDFDTSASGEDKIAENVTGSLRGPVKVTVSRGTSNVLLAYAGGPAVVNGTIDVGSDNTVNSFGSTNINSVRGLGPITETTPSSGIFEFDLEVRYTDGPASSQCPTTNNFNSLIGGNSLQTQVLSRFDSAPATNTKYCILQGDIITVEYTDPADASGDLNTVTDSATFDLRNGALQSDKSVYIIGSDMIMTLIDPDLDLDNDLAETYDLDLIEWDSDAATVTMGDEGNSATAFDPEPSDLRETGDSTGIFQTVIEIPDTLKNDRLERGEEIVLEYTDWGPSGADYVGQEDEDVNLTVFTSNFGATVELDQKVYTWTDKVYITVVAPDQNFDSNLVDEIGEENADPLKVATRGNSLNKYKLVETGTDTGIFTGEVILTGFSHDANGAQQSGGTPTGTTSGSGPTGGFLTADDDDGLTVSYEFSEDETVVGSALIRWNIGEVSWLEASYPASGTGVVRVIDPDMNLNPEAVDNFAANVWSDSDAGGIDLTVTETNEATGIFEGTVFFTTTDESSGHRLRVAEGDTVTAEYQDNTLPDPYTTADELDITGTAFIGTVVPPLERAPASNARVVDAFGNTLDEVSVDQQVQITADLTNGQDREQPFAYLVQIQDENGVTVSLAWITGSLSAGQSFSPALSWIATAPGTYTATVFVWESVDNPTALSPPVSVDITVS